MTARERVWARLREGGLVEGPLPAQSATSAPWFVSLLLGLCGWFAALFLLAFVAVGLTPVLTQPLACLVLGGIVLAAAYGLLRRQLNVFLDNLALAISLAGQALVLWAGLHWLESESAALWWAFALWQLALTVIMPNDIHRVFSAFAAASCVAAGLALLGWGGVYAPLALALTATLWLKALTATQDIQRVRMPAWGLTGALLAAQGLAHVFGAPTSPLALSTSQLWASWQGELLCLLVMLGVWFVLLQRAALDWRRPGVVLSLVGLFLIGLACVPAPGLCSAITLVLLGFALANRLLLGVGVLALLLFASRYYYLLDLTLLEKSGVLLLVAVLMLSVRLLLRHLSAGAPEPDHV